MMTAAIIALVLGVSLVLFIRFGGLKWLEGVLGKWFGSR